MGTITLLDEQLASQIAAGEVVERPASVVKELLENSLDAGALRIEVLIEGGGIERLVVIDDGKGMPPDDAELCFARHATSKLQDADGLRRIGSFGFRGEALAAISSVSKVQLTTRTADAEAASRVVVEAGHVVETGNEGAIVGTRFEMRDLFYNVPARRKFLKSERVEVSAIVEVVKNAALFAPKVTFRLLVDGKKRFESLGVQGDVPMSDPRHLERVVTCLGKQVRDVVYPLDVQTDLVHVVGFVVAPLETRRDFKGIILSVNKRPVKDKTLVQAVRAAFRPLLQTGRHPMVVLDVQMDLERVDVNVHPQKAEVRFEEPRRISGHLVRILTDFLTTTPWLEKGPAKTYRLGGERAGLQARPLTTQESSSSSSSSAARISASNAASFGSSAGSSEPHSPEENPRDDDLTAMHRARVRDALVRFEGKGRRAPLRGDLGRLPITGPRDAARGESSDSSAAGLSTSNVTHPLAHERYLFSEVPDGVLVVDVLAVKRATLFTMLCTKATEGVAAQPLLFPAQIQLKPDEVDRIESFSEALSTLGVDVNRFANDRILIRGVPAFINGGSVDVLCERLKNLKEQPSLEVLAEVVSAFPHPTYLQEQKLLSQALGRLDDEQKEKCSHLLSLSSLARWFPT
ncbi:MAG: DNA mismatch repair endonuclease MutL [Deltaproteobacteria bacterium]|nr:DNA mismatch repair endonuclease MutL [Deltaproteobacteria bacterium]